MIANWISTGDMFPWVLAWMAATSTVPPAVAGCVAAALGRRAPLAHAAVLAAVGFSVAVAVAAATVGGSVAQALVGAAAGAMSCLAGGILTALALRRGGDGERM